MPKTISFSKMGIENVVIFKQNNQWNLGVNLSLMSEGNSNLKQNVVMQLDEAQQLQVRKFLQPFIQKARDAIDIQDVVNFVDPEEE